MNKRAVCPSCDFILSRCLCDTLTRISNQTELIILQHPSETKHALNTVRLMKNSFQKIKIFIGENFNEHEELKTLLQNNRAALIFPNEKSETLSEREKSSITHLVFIDGSWKKAKKIYFSTTLLHSLPIYSLEPKEKSQYRIRSSQFSESLSTLEASTLALKMLEPELKTESLEKAFKKMIDFQIEKMGEEVFLNNYLSHEKKN